NQKAAVGQGAMVDINGRGLAIDSNADIKSTLPTVLGGVCVTLNNRALPLVATSPTQIRAQIPADIVPGRYPLMVRNIERKAGAAGPATVTLSKYAPAVLMDPDTNLAAIYKQDGTVVSTRNSTTRDQRLTIFAVGLGPTKGATIRPGE